MDALGEALPPLPQRREAVVESADPRGRREWPARLDRPPPRSAGLRRMGLPVGRGGGPLADHKGPEKWQADVLRPDRRRPAREAKAPSASPSPRATASASRRWSPGCCCGRWPPSPRRAASSPRTPRPSSRPRPGPSSASGTGSRSPTTGASSAPSALVSALPRRSRRGRIDMVPWAAHNAEAFAGLHNKGSRVLAGVRRGLGHRRPDLGNRRRRADRRRYRNRLGRLRQPDAHQRPLLRMLQPLPQTLAHPTGRFAQGHPHRQAPARALGRRLRRGLRLRARPRARQVPARRLHAVHRLASWSRPP